MQSPVLKQFDLSGQAAIVTGGSKGLGRAIAEALASVNARVAVVSRREEEAAATAADLRDRFETEALGISGDVRDETSVAHIVDATYDAWGRVDILVNNAGINTRGPIESLTYQQFREVQATNVDGLWLCSRAVVPRMRQAKRGRIINLGSTLSSVGLPDRTPYAASKGAVAQITRVLAMELAPDNILVNAICPGPFLTEMNRPIADTEDAKKHVLGATALKRWGELEEIQGVAVLLASAAGSYITGAMIPVDGGWTAG